MKSAETYKVRFQKLQKELKEQNDAYSELIKIRDNQRDQINNLLSQLNDTRYDLGRSRVRVDALEYALVLAQAHAAPMQRREFNNRGWGVQATPKEMVANFNKKDDLKVAS